MKNTFPTQKSILSSEAIKEHILTQYNLNGNYDCRFLTHGLNDTYRVKDIDQDYYLRVYRYEWRSKEDIISEIKLLNHLDKNEEISVASPIKKNNGEILLNSLVTKIITEEERTIGVLYRHTSKKDEKEIRIFANNIIANASVPITVGNLLYTKNMVKFKWKNTQSKTIRFF